MSSRQRSEPIYVALAKFFESRGTEEDVLELFQLSHDLFRCPKNTVDAVFRHLADSASLLQAFKLCCNYIPSHEAPEELVLQLQQLVISTLTDSPPVSLQFLSELRKTDYFHLVDHVEYTAKLIDVATDLDDPSLFEEYQKQTPRRINCSLGRCAIEAVKKKASRCLEFLRQVGWNGVDPDIKLLQVLVELDDADQFRRFLQDFSEVDDLRTISQVCFDKIVRNRALRCFDVFSEKKLPYRATARHFELALNSGSLELFDALRPHASMTLPLAKSITRTALETGQLSVLDQCLREFPAVGTIIEERFKAFSYRTFSAQLNRTATLVSKLVESPEKFSCIAALFKGLDQTQQLQYLAELALSPEVTETAVRDSANLIKFMYRHRCRFSDQTFLERQRIPTNFEFYNPALRDLQGSRKASALLFKFAREYESLFQSFDVLFEAFQHTEIKKLLVAGVLTSEKEVLDILSSTKTSARQRRL